MRIYNLSLLFFFFFLCKLLMYSLMSFTKSSGKRSGKSEYYNRMPTGKGGQRLGRAENEDNLIFLRQATSDWARWDKRSPHSVRNGLCWGPKENGEATEEDVIQVRNIGWSIFWLN